MAMKTVIMKIFDEDGEGYDLCECEVGSTRVIRVIESRRKKEGDGGPPHDAATATGMYDRDC